MILLRFLPARLIPILTLFEVLRFIQRLRRPR
jgi:hypothetical protein